MNKRKFSYDDGMSVAVGVVADLNEHCEKIEIVGSLKRHKQEISDVDILCIPKTEATNLLSGEKVHSFGFVEVITKHPKIKGNPKTGKFCQRIHDETGIHLEFYMCNKNNWGLMSIIRTGPALFSKAMMARLKGCGYQSRGGYIRPLGEESEENIIDTPEEEDVFGLCGMDYLLPQHRA